MSCYVGLDVSMKETAICVVNETGDRKWDGKSRTDPDAIASLLARRAAGAVRIDIETGPMTVWLWHALTERELPVVYLHARHAAAALKPQMNKTGRNEAFGLARLVRSGWYRPVAVRSMNTHRLRALLITRLRGVHGGQPQRAARVCGGRRAGGGLRHPCRAGDPARSRRLSLRQRGRRVVTETEPAGKAAQEVRDLYMWTCRQDGERKAVR